MINRSLLGTVAACGLSTIAAAQQSGTPMVEMRIVERAGKTAISGPDDAQLNFAVQARAIGGPANMCVAGFEFDIRIVGESDSWGTLARCLISNLDGTYTSAIAPSSAIGRGGLAAQYTYLARINASFNGVINTSVSTATNGPDQELSIVAGHAASAALLQTPGLDADGDGNPDTWSGNGTGAAPPFGVIVPLDPQIARDYFGMKNWIDMYRFRYTPTNFQPRALRLTFEGLTASTGRTLQNTSGVWGVSPASAGPPVAASDLVIAVKLPPAGACCTNRACSLKFQSECPTGFVGSSTCLVNPCDPYGGCCIDSVCATTLAAECTGYFHRAATCVPTPCGPPGACCATDATCTFVERVLCNGNWFVGQSCVAGWCGQAVRCCHFTGQTCTIATYSTCAGPLDANAGAGCTPNPCLIRVCCPESGGCRVSSSYCGSWSEQMSGTTCDPAPCTPVGACCDGTYGWCHLKTRQSCHATWLAATSCDTTTCPPLGACCTETWCYVISQPYCFGGGRGVTRAWQLGGTCAPGQCDQAGACCTGHACMRMFADECVSVAGRVFLGNSVHCSPQASNPIACCPANFNMIDGVTVIDVFDFLNAWFAFDLRSDFDRSGGISMADVFAFLNEWIGGC